MVKFQYSLKSIFVATLLIGLALFAISAMYRPETPFRIGPPIPLGPPIPVEPSTENGAPIVLITRHAGYVVVVDYHQPFVEFAIWRDGTVVWRKDASNPRSPLLTSKVEPSAIDQLFIDLSSARLLEPNLRTFYVGPSSGYVSIEIATDQGVVELASWHERFSNLPLAVCTESGVVGLEPGQRKQDVLTASSREYKLFMKNWNLVRDLSIDLSGSAGQPFDGVIPRLTK